MPDYGNGKTNIDLTTGIRYGVIHPNDVSGDWFSRFTPVYPEPDSVNCPKCDEINEWSGRNWGDDVACEYCEHEYTLEMPDCMDPIRYVYEANGIKAKASPERDIFVTKSPYVTQAPFCSPCAPGACYLMRATTYGEHGGEFCYCLPQECFDDDKAPYRVFDTKTLKEVKS